MNVCVGYNVGCTCGSCQERYFRTAASTCTLPSTACPWCGMRARPIYKDGRYLCAICTQDVT